jgi:hypothetical protein
MWLRRTFPAVHPAAQRLQSRAAGRYGIRPISPMDGATLPLRAAHEVAAPSAAGASVDDLRFSASSAEGSRNLARLAHSRLAQRPAASLESHRRAALGGSQEASALRSHASGAAHHSRRRHRVRRTPARASGGRHDSLHRSCRLGGVDPRAVPAAERPVTPPSFPGRFRSGPSPQGTNLPQENGGGGRSGAQRSCAVAAAAASFPAASRAPLGRRSRLANQTTRRRIASAPAAASDSRPSAAISGSLLAVFGSRRSLSGVPFVFALASCSWLSLSV